MNRFKVIIQPPARDDIESAYLYIHDRAPAAARRWLAGIEKAIQGLDFLPRRCAVAPESEQFTEEIRQLLYGKRGGIYRVLFVVRDDEVRVLHVRHGARLPMKRGEIQT